MKEGYIRKHSGILRYFSILIDILCIVASFSIAYTLHNFRIHQYRSYELYSWMVFVFSVIYISIGSKYNIFYIMYFPSFSLKELTTRVIKTVILSAVTSAAVLYILKQVYYSRYLYTIFITGSAIFIFFNKVFIRQFIIYMRKRGFFCYRICLFGKGKLLEEVEKVIKENSELGILIEDKIEEPISVEDFKERLNKCPSEEILFVFSRSQLNIALDPYIKICEEMGRTVRIFSNIHELLRIAKVESEKFLGYITFLIYTVELDPDQLLLKRIFDIIGGIIGMLINIILFPWIALAIKLDSPGPVIFKQKRIGKNMQEFYIYKYRSMVKDAEKMKKDLEDKNEVKGAMFKIKDDPRITRVGRFLRRTSLDELPQFWNVLKGDMSLVGTRPPTPEEVKKYHLWHYRRISIKPGITGLWQVSGRNTITDFDKIVELDLQYIDNWSLWLDIKIILKTILVVILRAGAF